MDAMISHNIQPFFKTNAYVSETNCKMSNSIKILPGAHLYMAKNQCTNFQNTKYKCLFS